MKILVSGNQIPVLNNKIFKVLQGDVEVENIFVANPPDVVEYSEGDALDLTGIVVKATLSNGMIFNVTDQCAFDPADGDILSIDDTEITITALDHETSQNITVSEIHIYGAEWSGGEETTWTRTDGAASFISPNPYYVGNTNPSSPFDTIMPWSGMVKEEIAGAGTCVKIPKYWYRWTRTGDAMKLQIANQATDGFLVSPAHANRGDGKGERDYVYVGRYHCSGTDYTSTTGVSPKTIMTRATFRTNIHNLGTNIWQYDFAMYWTIMMLYLVEFADWNSQKVIGYGCGNSLNKENTGASDIMPYHTGTMQSARNIYGVGVQYRNIEGLWDNVFDSVDGIYFKGANVYCIKNPADFSDTTGGVFVGTRVMTGAYIKAWNNPTVSGFEYALCPSATGGSNTKYISDRIMWSGGDDDYVVLYVGGGYYLQNLERGAFAFNCYSIVSESAETGSRLMYLP